MKNMKFDTLKDLKLKIRSRHSREKNIDQMDETLVSSIQSVREQIDIINTNLDHVDDPMIISSYIYELKALHTKYDYLLKQCKNRGITADFS